LYVNTVIVLLGAGSAAFTISIIKDILLSKGLAECTFRLMDINEPRLQEARKAAESYKSEAGSKVHIESYTDRRKALYGADFVICAVKIGGYKPLETERRIAEERGYYRGIGDRVSCYFGGVGAYWQLRFFEEVARDM
jgi:alpha-galactosidase